LAHSPRQRGMPSDQDVSRNKADRRRGIRMHLASYGENDPEPDAEGPYEGRQGRVEPPDLGVSLDDRKGCAFDEIRGQIIPSERWDNVCALDSPRQIAQELDRQAYAHFRGVGPRPLYLLLYSL
jgi:hypothetical protein